ncbi:MAG TPA: Maf family protein [Beijerinckiaceae bacterium]|nr:Maf family protein [Beijerinckiaceae bacterium]
MNTAPGSLWQADAPLVLASASAVRRALLEAVGVPFVAQPARIDERALEAASKSRDPVELARLLADAKALAVSQDMPNRYVLGADQTLSIAGGMLHKPGSRRAAVDQLMRLSGARHRLHAGLALAINGHVIWHHVETASLTMRPLSAAFVHAYLEAAGDPVLASVGVYQIEALGMHLFEAIEGDHSTIMGLPLMPLLGRLRMMGLVLE